MKLVVALAALVVAVEAGKKGGCRGNSDGVWAPHGQHQPPPDKAPEDKTPLSEENAAWFEAYAMKIYETFSTSIASHPELVEKWEADLDPRERLGLVFRMVKEVEKALLSDAERYEMAHTLWALAEHAHDDEEVVAKWEASQGDAHRMIHVALYALRGGNFKKIEDDEKKDGIYEADLDGAKADWEAEGEEGPETIEATRLYVACLDAKRSPDECETQYKWVTSCIDCETATAESESSGAFPWMVCLVGTLAVIVGLLIFVGGYTYGRRRLLRKASVASPVAPAPTDAETEKALAAKLQAMEA